MAIYRDRKDEIQHLIEEMGLTQRETAEQLGIGRRSVERCCSEYQLRTQRRGPRGGSRHPNWKGGRVKLGAYWYIYRPDHPHCTKKHQVAEHRLVMEAKLGRYLLPTEVVHHIDGDPENNAPENLEVFESNAEHLRHELAGRVPQWSDAGRRRILEGVRRSARSRPPRARDALGRWL